MKRFLLLLGGLAATSSAQAPRFLDLTTGTLGAMPAEWRLTTPTAWHATTVETDATNGERALCIRRLPDQADATPVGVVMRSLPTDVTSAYRNRRVILAAQLRVEGEGRAQLWLRVDRKGDRTGGFDNMHDRPITGDTWQTARIELDVDGDAQQLTLGILAFGDVSVYARDCVLTDQGPARAEQAAVAGPLGERELQNVTAAARLLGQLWFFHPSPAAVEFKAWDRFSVRLMEVARPAADASDLCQRLQQECAQLAPSVQLWIGGPGAAPALPAPPAEGSSLWSWRHKGAGRIAKPMSTYASRVQKKPVVSPIEAAEHEANHAVLDLGGGVAARIPFRVPVPPEEKRAKSIEASWLGDEAPKLKAHHRDTRLAAVAMAWCVFEHFYPYFDVVEVDWAAELPRTLAAAAVAKDDAEFAAVLEHMVARLQDGHGGVSWGGSPRTFLPIAVRLVGDELVVLASKDPELRRGDVVLSIDGRSIAAITDEQRRRTSAATKGFADYVIASELPLLASADPALLQVRRADGSIADLRVARTNEFLRAGEPERPANGAELAPGIVYFDLNGAANDALEEALPTLAAAKGIIFDLRGYPGAAGSTVLQHLITERATSARWNVPVVTTPGRDHWQWDESGRWQLRPKQPHLGGKIAFLTDGRAISYAESVMGIVEAYRLGAIVGSTTAGTNGNVNPFELPGGFTISWTGMRVLKHDGSRHHGVGIVPTVPVEPTVAGIAAGRDEVLEKAIAVLQQQIDGK